MSETNSALSLQKGEASDLERSTAKESDRELHVLELVLVVVGLCLAIFLMAIDTSIIATAIPRITSEYGQPMTLVGTGARIPSLYVLYSPLEVNFMRTFR